MDSSKQNVKSLTVKRLMREAIELAEPTEEYYATPLEDNLFEWHFTVRGPPNTPFEGGFYHGRIILPNDYPLKPPDIIVLTPNGRFETNKKICLSISQYHPESWQPGWSIRTALLAIIAFMPTSAEGTIGSLDYTSEERRRLAIRSHKWECSVCGLVPAKLLMEATHVSAKLTKEESSLIEQIAFKSEEETKKPDGSTNHIENDLDKAPTACSLNSTFTSEIEPASETVITQRLLTDEHKQANVASNTETNIFTEDSLLRMSRTSTNRDQIWARIVWLLLSLIITLLVRRIFFV